MNPKKRVLVASPVQQKPAILEHFLAGLVLQQHPNLELGFVFVDDNHDPESSRLLQAFAADHGDVTVVPVPPAVAYKRDEFTHHWNEQLIWRVAEFKDAIIDDAVERGFDALFLADSDLVLRPGTVAHLVSLDEHIVSEVFWTSWKPGIRELPQVWLHDQYDLAYRDRGEQLTAEEQTSRTLAFLDLLSVPGVYDVGGLGACTLISATALRAGVRFAEIPNVLLWGEDRHFCIRAMAMGFRLRASTHLPPLHLYRESELARVEEFTAGWSVDHALESTVVL